MPEIKNYSQWSADNALDKDPIDALREYTDYARMQYLRSGVPMNTVEPELRAGVEDKLRADNLLNEETTPEQLNELQTRLFAPKTNLDFDAAVVQNYLALDDPDSGDEETKNNSTLLRDYLAKKKYSAELAAPLEGAVKDLLQDSALVRRARVAAVDRGEYNAIAVTEDDGSRSIYAGSRDLEDNEIPMVAESLVRSGALDTSDLVGLQDNYRKVFGGKSTLNQNARSAMFNDALDSLSKTDSEIADILSGAASAASKQEALSREGFVGKAAAFGKGSAAAPFVGLGEAVGAVFGQEQPKPTGAEIAEYQFRQGDGTAVEMIRQKLLENPAMRKRFSEQEITDFTNDRILKQTDYKFDNTKPESGLRQLSTGEVNIAPALLVSPQKLEDALGKAPLNEDQKEFARRQRAALLDVRVPQMLKLISSSSDEAVSAYATAKQNGVGDREFVEQWLSNEDNYGMFSNTASSLAYSGVQALGSVPLGIASLLGSEKATTIMLRSQAKQARYAEYGALFGDEFGLTREALTALPAVAVDIALTIGTAGVGRAVSAAARAGSMTARTLAKGAVGVLDDAALAAVRGASAGAAAETSAALQAAGRSWISKAATTAVEQTIPVALPAFTRSASSTYVSIYGSLPEDMTHEEKHKQAIGFALAAGVGTAAITAGLSALGAGGVEKLGVRTAAKGLDDLTYREAKVLFETVKNEGKAVSDKAFRDALAAEVGGNYKRLIGGAVTGFRDEAFEEALDQSVNMAIEDAALKRNRPLAEKLQQVWNAGLIGGVLGGGLNVASQAFTPTASAQTKALQQRTAVLDGIAKRLSTSNAPETAASVQRMMDAANAAAVASTKKDAAAADAQAAKAPTTAVRTIEEGNELGFDDPRGVPPADTRIADLVGERVFIDGTDINGIAEIDADTGEVVINFSKPTKVKGKPNVTRYVLGRKYQKATGLSLKPKVKTLTKAVGSLPVGTRVFSANKMEFVLPTIEAVDKARAAGKPLLVLQRDENQRVVGIKVRGVALVKNPAVTTDTTITDPELMREVLRLYPAPATPTGGFALESGEQLELNFNAPREVEQPETEGEPPLIPTGTGIFTLESADQLELNFGSAPELEALGEPDDIQLTFRDSPDYDAVRGAVTSIDLQIGSDPVLNALHAARLDQKGFSALALSFTPEQITEAGDALDLAMEMAEALLEDTEAFKSPRAFRQNQFLFQQLNKTLDPLRTKYDRTIQIRKQVERRAGRAEKRSSSARRNQRAAARGRDRQKTTQPIRRAQGPSDTGRPADEVTPTPEPEPTPTPEPEPKPAAKRATKKAEAPAPAPTAKKAARKAAKPEPAAEGVMQEFTDAEKLEMDARFGRMSLRLDKMMGRFSANLSRDTLANEIKRVFAAKGYKESDTPMAWIVASNPADPNSLRDMEKLIALRDWAYSGGKLAPETTAAEPQAPAPTREEIEDWLNEGGNAQTLVGATLLDKRGKPFKIEKVTIDDDGEPSFELDDFESTVVPLTVAELIEDTNPESFTPYLEAVTTEPEAGVPAPTEEKPKLEKLSDFRGEATYKYGKWRISTKKMREYRYAGGTRKATNWTSWNAYSTDPADDPTKIITGTGGADFAAKELDKLDSKKAAEPEAGAPAAEPAPKSSSSFYGKTYGEWSDENTKQKAKLSEAQKVAMQGIQHLNARTGDRNLSTSKRYKASDMGLGEVSYDTTRSEGNLLALRKAQELGLIRDLSTNAKTFYLTGRQFLDMPTGPLPFDVFPEAFAPTPEPSTPPVTPVDTALVRKMEKFYDTVDETLLQSEKKPAVALRLAKSALDKGYIAQRDYDSAAQVANTAVPSVKEIKDKARADFAEGTITKDERDEAIADAADTRSNELDNQTQEALEDLRSSVLTRIEELKRTGTIDPQAGTLSTLAPQGDNELRQNIADIPAALRGMLPAGFVLAADPNMDGALGYNAVTDPTVVRYNPNLVGSITIGLARADALATLRTAVDHELGHAAAEEAFGQDGYESLAVELGEDMLTNIASIYYSLVEPDFNLRAERIKADRESGALPDWKIAAEWVRMEIERIANGRTSEQRMLFLRTNPSLLAKFIDALGAFVTRLRARFFENPTTGTAASISNAARQLRKLKNGGYLPAAPKADLNYGGHAAELIGAIERGSDQTLFTMPIGAATAAGKAQVEGLWTRIGKKFQNLPPYLRDNKEERDGIMALGNNIILNFNKRFSKLTKENPAIPIDDIRTVLGRTDPTLDNAALAQIQTELDAFAGALPFDMDTVLAEEMIDKERDRLQQRERLASNNAFRQEQQSAEQRIRNAGAPALADLLVKFRTDINNMSARFTDLSPVIDENMGVYLTRTYRFHNTEGWALLAKGGIQPDGSQLGMFRGKEIDFAKLRDNAARTYEQDALAKAAKDGVVLTAEQLRDRTHGMLDEYLAKLQGSAESSPSPSQDSLQKDLTKLMPKGNINKELMELLGVVEDPLENAVRTMVAVTKIAANNTFLHSTYDTLLSMNLASTKQTPEMNVKALRVDKDGSLSPLSDLFTTPEIANALQAEWGVNARNAERNTDSVMREGGRALMAVASFATTTKTLFSFGFYPRNAVSGQGLLLSAQGILPINKYFLEAYGLARRAYFESNERTPEQDAMIQRLIELQVLADDTQGRVAMDIMRGFVTDNEQDLDALLRDFQEATEGKPKKLLDRIGSSTAGKVYGKSVDWLASLNNWFDGAVKTQAFMYELDVLKKDNADALAKDPLLLAGLELRAADKVKMTMPSHSRQLPIVKSLNQTSVGMVFFPFARWKTEVFRTMYNTPRLALKEIREGGPAEKARGYRRMFGFTSTLIFGGSAVGAVYAGLFRIIGGLLGEDEEKKDARELTNDELYALRESLPVWQRGHALHTRLVGGQVQVIDMTAITPYAQLTDLFVITHEGIVNKESDWNAKRTAGYVAQQLIGTQIAATALNEALNNSDDFGQPIYRDTDNPVEVTGKILAHFGGSALKPAAFDQLGRAFRSGEQDRWEIITGELLGARPRNHKMSEIEYRAFRGVKKMLDDSAQIKASLVTGRKLDEDEVVQTLEDHQESLNRTQRKLAKVMQGLQSMGSTRGGLYGSGKNAGFSAQRLELAEKGDNLRWVPNQDWLKGVYQNMTRTGEDDPMNRINLIRRTLSGMPATYGVSE